jgi:hypothetical protein
MHRNLDSIRMSVDDLQLYDKQSCDILRRGINYSINWLHEYLDKADKEIRNNVLGPLQESLGLLNVLVKASSENFKDERSKLQISIQEGQDRLWNLIINDPHEDINHRPILNNCKYCL